jgi:hypothetical protein
VTKDPREVWFRVTTPGYVAAVCVVNGTIIQAAPILRRYVGMNWRKAKYQLRRHRRPEQFSIENLSGGYDYDDCEPIEEPNL